MAFKEIFSSSLEKALGISQAQSYDVPQLPQNEIEKSSKLWVPTYRDEDNTHGQTPDDAGGMYGIRFEICKQIYRHNIVVFAAVQTIISEIIAAKWHIKQKDEDEETNEEDLEKRIKEIENFLENPNENKETFTVLLEKMLLDLLIFDQGCIEKVRDHTGRLKELYAVAGDTIRIKIDEHGKIKGYWQVIVSGSKKFDPKYVPVDDLMILSMNPNSWGPYGYSVCNLIDEHASAFLYGTAYNINFFRNNATPRGILEIGPTSEQQLDRFKEMWATDNVGKPHKVVVLSNPYAYEGKAGVKWIPMAMSAKDMDWERYMNWTMKMILLGFGVTPSEVGFADNLQGAPATGQIIQSQAFKNKAIYPMMTRIATYITKEIISMEFGYDDLIFEFVEEYSVQEQTQKAQLDMILINAGIKTVEEVRKERGLKAQEGEDDDWGFGDFERERRGEKTPQELQESAGQASEVDQAFGQLKQAIYETLGIQQDSTGVSQQIEQEYQNLRTAVEQLTGQGKKPDLKVMIEQAYNKLVNQIQTYLALKG